MKFRTFFHPLFFSVYPIVYLYSANLGEVQAADALVPALLSLISAAVLLFVSRALTADDGKAALMVTGACFAFYAYGAFDSLMISLSDSQNLRGFWFPLLWFLTFLAGEFAIWRHRESTMQVSGFLNTMALILLLIVSGNIAIFHLTADARLKKSHGVAGETVLTINASSTQLPDIYYLILDGYARQDILKTTYEADNSEFTAFLQSAGFYVASQSWANYPQTYLSLASSLNYTYLDTMAAKFYDQNSVEPLVEMVRNNNLFAVLKKAGYLTVGLSSGYSGTELRNADIYLSRTLLGREFFDSLISSTFLAALKLPFFDMSVSQADVHRGRIRETLEALPELKLPAGPVVVFAHLTCPHPPFVFGPAGENINPGEKFHIFDGSHWGNDVSGYRRQYRDQLIYVTRLVKEMLSKLLAAKSRQRIIIIQSDHGPGSVLDWQNHEKTDLRERFGILNAVHLGGRSNDGLYPGISPINTIRFVLNQLLREKLPLLPDKSFFAPWFGRYRFIDITDKLAASKH